MEALGHGAELRGHQARRLRTGQAQGADILVRVQLEHLGHRGRRAEGAGQAAGMEAAVEGAGADRIADAGAQLVAGDNGQDDVLAAEGSETLGRGQHGGDHAGAVVRHGLVVAVIQLIALSRRAVDESRAQRIGLDLHAPGAGLGRLIEQRDGAGDRLGPGGVGPEHAAAQTIADALLGVDDQIVRQVLILQARGELGHHARDRQGLDRDVGVHKITYISQ